MSNSSESISPTLVKINILTDPLKIQSLNHVDGHKCYWFLNSYLLFDNAKLLVEFEDIVLKNQPTKVQMIINNITDIILMMDGNEIEIQKKVLEKWFILKTYEDLRLKLNCFGFISYIFTNRKDQPISADQYVYNTTLEIMEIGDVIIFRREGKDIKEEQRKHISIFIGKDSNENNLFLSKLGNSFVCVMNYDQICEYINDKNPSLRFVQKLYFKYENGDSEMAECNLSNLENKINLL
jgi:hypothetical protein